MQHEYTIVRLNLKKISNLHRDVNDVWACIRLDMHSMLLGQSQICTCVSDPLVNLSCHRSLHCSGLDSKLIDDMYQATCVCRVYDVPQLETVTLYSSCYIYTHQCCTHTQQSAVRFQ